MLNFVEGVSNRVSKSNARQPNAESFSDLESIKTEEYENRFQAIATDRVAPLVLTAKNKLLVDSSDGDTICSLGNAENSTIKQSMKKVLNDKVQILRCTRKYYQ